MLLLRAAISARELRSTPRSCSVPRVLRCASGGLGLAFAPRLRLGCSKHGQGRCLRGAVRPSVLVGGGAGGRDAQGEGGQVQADDLSPKLLENISQVITMAFEDCGTIFSAVKLVASFASSQRAH